MKHVVEIASGTLTLDLDRADLPLHDLCGFADRHNARRSFLFVSKVLGKHHPVRPSVMADVHARIAGKLSADLPGPVLFVALAETAIGLGQSVYEAYRSTREDVVFVHSTRYAVGSGRRIPFSEAHSHAPSHLLHVPVDADAMELFVRARSLVLVDDEISTGNTLVNVARAIRAEIPSIAHVTLACITDWSREDGAIGDRIGLPVSFASISSGRFSFAPRAELSFAPAPVVEVPFATKDHLSSNFGRLGITALPALGPVPVVDGKSVLVLGTGEFSYLPFKLALALEQRGHEVEFQATTRSPIHVGGAIGAKIELVDNYFDGMPNFLYNARPGSHDVTITCYESPRIPPEHTLPALFGAQIWTRG